MAKFYTPTKLSENMRKTPEGFLLCLGVPIARTGYQKYAEGETPLEVGPDGTVTIHRDALEVFRPQTIASFLGKALTIRHPRDFVDPNNWNFLAKGEAHNVRRGDELDEDGEESLLADLLWKDAMAISLIENGLREISCGYEAEYEQTGEGEGRQFNIIGNHIALVESGRAGSAYAINDSKERVIVMDELKKLAEQISNLGKTIDAAMKKVGGKKKTEDADESDKDKEKEAKDAGAYDELIKAVKDLSDKVEGMMKPKDEEKPAPKEDKEKKASDEEEMEGESEDDDQQEMKMEERLKALEAAVAKLLKMEASENESEDDEEEMSGSEDEDMEESEESEDADEKSEGKKEKVGDEATAEILAPGVKVTKGEDIKVKALKTAYATDEGKKVIHTLTGGKKPVYDSKEQVDMLFRASAELLKTQRGVGLEGSKDGKKFKVDDNGQAEAMTPEKLNEINAAHWANRK